MEASWGVSSGLWGVSGRSFLWPLSQKRKPHVAKTTTASKRTPFTIRVPCFFLHACACACAFFALGPRAYACACACFALKTTTASKRTPFTSRVPCFFLKPSLVRFLGHLLGPQGRPRTPLESFLDRGGLGEAPLNSPRSAGPGVSRPNLKVSFKIF